MSVLVLTKVVQIVSHHFLFMIIFFFAEFCRPLLALVGGFFRGPVEHVESAAEPTGERNNSLTAQLSESVHERMNRKEEGEAP